MSSKLQQAFEQGKEHYDQAEQTKDKAEALKLLKTAERCFQELFRLAEEAGNKQQQSSTKFLLGNCVYKQVQYAEDKAEALKLLERAEEHFQEYFRLAEEAGDKQRQINAKFLLGCCVYKQVQYAEDKAEAQKLLETAKEHFQESFRLAEEAGDKQQQGSAKLLSGCCVYEQVQYAEDKAEAQKLLETAKECFQEFFRLAEEIDDKQEQSFARSWLGECLYKQAEYTEQPNEKLEELFNFQKESIQSDFLNILNKNGETADSVQNSIIEILTVLNICPYELEGLPLAHYTSPYVAELLFGIKDKDKDSDTDKEEDKDNNIAN